MAWISSDAVQHVVELIMPEVNKHGKTHLNAPLHMYMSHQYHAVTINIMCKHDQVFKRSLMRPESFLYVTPGHVGYHWFKKILWRLEVKRKIHVVPCKCYILKSEVIYSYKNYSYHWKFENFLLSISQLINRDSNSSERDFSSEWKAIGNKCWKVIPSSHFHEGENQNGKGYIKSQREVPSYLYSLVIVSNNTVYTWLHW